MSYYVSNVTIKQLLTLKGSVPCIPIWWTWLSTLLTRDTFYLVLHLSGNLWRHNPPFLTSDQTKKSNRQHSESSLLYSQCVGRIMMAAPKENSKWLQRAAHKNMWAKVKTLFYLRFTCHETCGFAYMPSDSRRSVRLSQLSQTTSITLEICCCSVGHLHPWLRWKCVSWHWETLRHWKIRKKQSCEVASS